MKYLLIKLISVYQVIVSPDHGLLSQVRPYQGCRYYPSCSEYAKRAIVSQGVVKGIARSAWRIVRCNPFSKGGYDPVTNEKLKLKK